MKIDSPNAIGTSTGFGIPTGGTTNQVLSKVNSTNLNTQWVDNGVPIWTTVGTIQSVGITAPTTAPTLPSNTTINTIMYKQLGPKTHSVRGSIAVPSATLTGNINGNGDYLLTLPNGLQFDTSVVGQAIYTGDNLTNSALLIAKTIPGSWTQAWNASTASQGWQIGIIPYSATQYRVLLPIQGNAVRCWSSGWFQLVNNTASEIDWQFDFQST